MIQDLKENGYSEPKAKSFVTSVTTTFDGADAASISRREQIVNGLVTRGIQTSHQQGYLKSGQIKEWINACNAFLKSGLFGFDIDEIVENINLPEVQALIEARGINVQNSDRNGAITRGAKVKVSQPSVPLSVPTSTELDIVNMLKASGARVNKIQIGNVTLEGVQF